MCLASWCSDILCYYMDWHRQERHRGSHKSSVWWCMHVTHSCTWLAIIQVSSEQHHNDLSILTGMIIAQHVLKHTSPVVGKKVVLRVIAGVSGSFPNFAVGTLWWIAEGTCHYPSSSERFPHLRVSAQLRGSNANWSCFIGSLIDVGHWWLF